MTVLKTPLLHTEVHVHPMSRYVYTGLAENTVMEVWQQIGFQQLAFGIEKVYETGIQLHNCKDYCRSGNFYVKKLLYNKFSCKKFS